MRVTLVLSLAVAVSGGLAHGHTQLAAELPNPYRPVENHFKLAEGRWWGSTSAVDIDIDGRSIWVAERCAANSCAGSKLNPILKFDEAGRLRRRFGEGLFILPHGIHVDREGNVWVTDAGGPDGTDPDRDGKGHAVYKFSPTGRLLLALGTPGVAGDGTGPLLNGPSDVVTAPNGDVFVADGAGGLDPDVSPPTGAFITAWGTAGPAPGEFRAPRGLALDQRGRLFVADRGNARIQIFDQEGRFLDAWTQFGRASGIYIDRNDRLYAADRESSVSSEGWGNGIRIGSALDGSLLYFIADSGAPPTDTRGLAGVAVDGQGNVFGASVDPEIPPRALMKYVKY
jgi:hypothetical protein